MKKYEFTGETKTITTDKEDVTLHRIRAVANFGDTKAGELGGWIEKEHNLSHDGDAWVSGNAWVYGDAQVYDNAWVYSNAEVHDNAKICGDAEVYGDVKVYGNAEICGIAKICGNVIACNSVCDNDNISNVMIYRDTKTYGNAEIYGNAKVWGNAQVYGNAEVWGNAQVYGNAEIFSLNHVLVIGAIGSRNNFITFYRGKNKQIMVDCGCFNGTLDEFLEKVEKTHGNNKHAAVYRAAAVVARLQIDLSAVTAEKTLE